MGHVEVTTDIYPKDYMKYNGSLIFGSTCMYNKSGLQIRLRTGKLSLNQNMCCGSSKELSQ